MDDEPGIWDHPETRDALRVGDWALVVRTAQAAGFSQTEIAARVGISQAQVSRLASGRTRNPGIGTIRALCDGLGIPRRYAGLADDDGGDGTDRRQFLVGTLGLAASAVLSSADHDDQRLVMLTTQSYRQLEQTTPARTMIGAVTGHLGLARQLAAHTRGAQQARMHAAVAEVAGLLGWLHADTARPEGARAHYRLAIEASTRAGNPLLPTYMQASLGQYAVSVGDTVQGLRLIRDAAGRLPRAAPRAAWAWLAASEAVALAHLGDADAWRMVDQAERHAAAGELDEPVWPWVFRVDAAKIQQYRAGVAARLGGRGAFELSDAAGQLGRSPKQTALTAVERARILVATGDLDQACRMASQAYDLGLRYGSERVRLAVRDFRAILPSKSPAVDELDDRLNASYEEPT